MNEYVIIRTDDENFKSGRPSKYALFMDLIVTT